MKIPSHATCVFKGLIYDVYQWEQEIYDGSVKTFEALKRRHTVIVIPIIGDQIYYGEQTQPGKEPYLSLFGGRAEDNEEPLETAKRELREETGLISDDWQQLRCYPAQSKIEWNVYYFVARNCSLTGATALDGGEKIQIKKTPIDDFLQNILPLSNFGEWEIRQEILSAFDPIKAEAFKNEIIGQIA